MRGWQIRDKIQKDRSADGMHEENSDFLRETAYDVARQFTKLSGFSSVMVPMTAALDLSRQLGDARKRPSPRWASSLRALLVLAAAGASHTALAQIAPAMTPAPSPGGSPNITAALHARAVTPDIIPPPPLREIADPKHAAGQAVKITQAKQQFVNPERAYDPNTGESFYWDCTEKSWFDSRTHRGVGFQGAKGSDGEVIPPPPKLELADSERVTSEGLMARITQAKQDAYNPARAVDPDSKQILVWDHRQKSWIDTKTGEAIGFLGRKGVSACQQAGAPMAPPSEVALLAQAEVLDDLLFKEHVAPQESSLISSSLGQALLQMELLLTSKQSVIGGPMRLSASRTEAQAKLGPASSGPASSSPESSGSPNAGASSSACPPPSCRELPAFLQLSRAMLAGPL